MYEGGKERVLRLLEVQLVNTPSNLKRITSTALGAWKISFMPFKEIMTDRPTDVQLPFQSYITSKYSSIKV